MNVCHLPTPSRGALQRLVVEFPSLLGLVEGIESHIYVTQDGVHELGGSVTPWKEMSLVTLQLGQCGNQLGFELLNLLGSEILSAPTDTLDVCFRQSQDGHFTPRSLLIDMEPKVVNACLHNARSQGTWAYDPANAVVQQSGSGQSYTFTVSSIGVTLRNGAVDLSSSLQATTGHLDITGMAPNALRPS